MFSTLFYVVGALAVWLLVEYPALFALALLFVGVSVFVRLKEGNDE